MHQDVLDIRHLIVAPSDIVHPQVM